MSGPVVRVVFGGVSTFKSRGVGARYFSSFLMLRIICVRYRTAICEKVFIGLLILYCGILKSKRFLMDGGYGASCACYDDDRHEDSLC